MRLETNENFFQLKVNNDKQKNIYGEVDYVVESSLF